MKFKALATGIGSLPHHDADLALELIFKYLPNIPFWPQLPKRDLREGMVAQFSENLPCLRFTGDGVLFDTRNKDEELEKFYGKIIAGDKEYFKISSEFALGLYKFYQRLEKNSLKDLEFIKLQVTGPFTFAASINQEDGTALLHDEVFFQVVLKGLIMKALWQINLFKKFGKSMIIFIDEPYLGCFGSAYTPIDREKVVGGLAEFTSAIKSEGVLTGVHCCGNTDWSMLTDVKTIDIISFDAFEFSDKFVLYADNIKRFLERSGIICWGIVPTSSFAGNETVDLLVRKLKGGISTFINKGIREELILENLLISPSCGLGTFEPQKAEKIFKLLSETSIFMRDSS